MAKTKTEKKLLKNAHKFAALEAELQMVFPPKIFAAIEALAAAHLKEQKFDHQSRDLVSKLAFLLRQETFIRFGHESLETIALAKLLRREDRGFVPPPPRLDSISHMRTYVKDHRLNAQQEAAAEMIKAVWVAFGKFRFIGARGMEGGGGASQVLHPLDVMGDDLWAHYKGTYCPWYAMAQKLGVQRRRYRMGNLSLAAICFKVLVEDYFPEEVDNNFGLVKGTCYRGLKVALLGYYDHEVLRAYERASISAEDTREDERRALLGTPSTPKL